MLRLYITRHGETEWNVKKILQGWEDSPLTEKGKSEAGLLGEYLNEVEFTAVYTSSSKRTIDTAEIICKNKSIKIIPKDNLREISMGDWEGKTVEEIEQNFSEELKAFWQTPHLYNSINGETFADVYARAVSSINEIISEHRDGNVLIVTHGVLKKSILAHFKNITLDRLWDPPYIYNTSLSIVEIKDEEANIALEGSIKHLEG